MSETGESITGWYQATRDTEAVDGHPAGPRDLVLLRRGMQVRVDVAGGGDPVAATSRGGNTYHVNLNDFERKGD
jgi:hypothetical protein